LGAFLRLDAAKDLNGGEAVQGTLQTDLFDVSVLAEHAQYFDFASERVEDGSDPLSSFSGLRLDGAIDTGFLPSLPFSLSGEAERRESGRLDLTLGGRLSAFFDGWSVSNSLAADLALGEGGGTTTVDGSLLVNTRFDSVTLRGDIDYSVSPDWKLTSVALTGDYLIEDGFTARAGVSKQLTDDFLTTYSAGLFRDFDHFAVGLAGEYSDDGAVFAGLSLSFALGREPRTGSFAMEPRQIAGDGALSARAFLDKNLNDLFDAGDEPIEGVAFRGAGAEATTDAHGQVMVFGLASASPTEITLDPASLPDPYWMPSHDGVAVVGRPGATAVIDFPVVVTGEIDGTVFLARGTTTKEVSNVELQLVAADGTLVQETKSAFDGFYLFQSVRPGRYGVRVAPAQIARLKLAPDPGRAVEIDGEGTPVSGIDIVVRPLP
jgi:hypothetical protein